MPCPIAEASEDCEFSRVDKFLLFFSVAILGGSVRFYFSSSYFDPYSARIARGRRSVLRLLILNLFLNSECDFNLLSGVEID